MTATSEAPAAQRTPGGPAVPLLYDCVTTHRRRTTIDRRFAYATTYWLIDVDAVPELPRGLSPLARFRAADHLGDPAGSLAGNVRTFLAGHGITAGRILLLTTPQVLRHVFNPLSVYYCFADGECVAVVAEVHNTYGGRHVYLLRPDDQDRDEVDKRFYVSPFLPIGGRYRMRVPVPGARLSVSIELHLGDTVPFVATLTGRGRPATTGAVLRASLRRPLLALRTSTLIRWQGIRLWLRGIPVHHRPDDATGPETSAR